MAIATDDGDEEKVTLLSQFRLIVRDGDEVKAGDPITDGPFDPKELMEIKGVRETQQYLVEEVQKVYRDQGCLHPRQAHRADRAPDDAPHRRAGAWRHGVPAR